MEWGTGVRARPVMLPMALLAAIAFSIGTALPGQTTAPLPRKGAFGAQLAPAQGGGIQIAGILPKLTAEAAGFKTGDVLVDVDGTALTTTADLVQVMRKHNAGDSLKIGYKRDGKTESKIVKLLERPKQSPTDRYDVIYDQVVSQGKRIRLIVTHPKKPGKFPIVMLLGGIGGYSVDGDFATVPYGEFLTKFAEMDYCTARIDKPGQGDSEGPIYPELTFNTELDAYRQALAALPKYDFVDQDRMVLFGHSMGSAFGPILGSEKAYKGVIVASGMVKSWPEYLIENSRRQMVLAGVPESQIGAEMRRFTALQHYLFYEGKKPAEIAKEHPELAGTVAEIIPDGRTYSGVGLQFFKELSEHDVAGDWAKVQGKVLLLCGENDFIASLDDHPLMEKIVNQAHPGAAKFVKVPQSDHGFYQTSSFADARAKWGRPGSVFNPAVLTIIADWLKENI